METLSTLNLLAVIHLLLVGGILVCGFIEVIFEYYGLYFDKSFHHNAIRLHCLVDSFVEIPLFIGVAVTGGYMVYHLETITPLHYLKIGFSILMVLLFFNCAYETFRRYYLLKRNADEQVLIASTKKMMVRNFAIVGVLTGVVICSGFWLSYHRLIN